MVDSTAAEKGVLVNENPMGFYFDQQACIGCRTCQIACKDKNNLDVGMLFREVKSYETGVFPNARTFHLSMTCNNCANPACVAVCPVGAMYIDEEDGTTQHDDEMCIGCQMCINACPYGVPKFDDGLSISRKCDSCIILRAKGEQPACVSSCIMRALEFGPIDRITAAHPDAVDQIAVLPESSQTMPSLRIAPRKAALETECRQITL